MNSGVVILFLLLKELPIIVRQISDVLKKRLSELKVAVGFKFLFQQMESVCGKPWQKVEVR